MSVQFIESIYQITIQGQSGVAPNDGFIDPTNIVWYMANGAPAPTSLANSMAKTRANIRFKFLQQQLNQTCNIYTNNSNAIGANCNTPASSLVFNAVIERGDSFITTYDELNVGVTLTGVDALTRMVARALIESRTSMEVNFYDPTQTSAPGNSTVAQRVGVRTDYIAIGPVAANLAAATTLVTSVIKIV